MAKRGTKKEIKEKRQPLKLTPKQQLKWLKLLPRDFRDLVPGSLPWRMYAQVMGPEVTKAMKVWRMGPILCNEKPDETELRFRQGRKLVSFFTASLPQVESIDTLAEVWKYAEKEGFSYVYLRNWAHVEIEGLNVTASRFKSTVRFKRRLEPMNDEHRAQ